MADLQWLPTPYSYSAAVAAGEYIFLGLHTGHGPDFISQFDEAIQKAAATLAVFGIPLANLVKIQVWLKNIEDLPVMEKRMLKYFEKDRFPARMTATTQFIDQDRLVMIEGIAYRGNLSEEFLKSFPAH